MNKIIEGEVVRLTKIIAMALMIVGFSMTSAMASYNVGLKYYNKYVQEKIHIRGLILLQKLHITNPKQLDDLFKNNAAGFRELLIKKGYAAGAEGLEELISNKFKAKHLKDIRDFLNGLLNGKLRAVCS